MSDQDILSLLKGAHTIAVVGISDKPDRDSFRVAQYLQENGYRVVPVNPMVDSVLGEKSYAALSDVPSSIDIVDIFRKPDAALPIVEEAIALGAGAVWLQLGVVNEEAAALAAGASLQVVMDRCIKVEHRRLLG
jgi:predicted CoA-binding protein